jgi:type VI secretion system protein ImpG
VDRYYEEELRYLQEAGQEFAEKHPERAAFLRLESKDRDPYVERLLEGFAFLAGRIRERLDDDYPEFTRTLLEVLFPQVVRPVPSMTMMQFVPRRSALQTTQTIPRGTSVYSTPVGRDGVSCRFTTAAEVRLHPLTLEEARLDPTSRGRHLVRLRFAFDRGVDPRALALDPLRITLHGEPTLTGSLYLFLTHHVERVVAHPAGGEPRVIGGPEAVAPAGFDEAEALLPYEHRAFPGFRHLQEYFAFRDRFLALDLAGLSRAGFDPKTAGFELELHLDRDYPEEKRFNAGNLRLHCVPAVNLFLAETEPVRVEPETLEYTLTADARYPTAVEIWAIDSVESVRNDRRRHYRPMFGFEPAARETAELAGRFVVTQRVGAMGRWHTALRLSRPAATLLDGDPEALSIRAWCTNGSHPRDLGENSVTVPGPDFPEYAQFSNLTRPTPPSYPPQGEELEWRLISHFALNQRSVDSADTLRALLELYDWSGSPAHRRRLLGIRRLALTPEERLHEGALTRGVRVDLEVAEDHFLDRADAYLFGVLMSRFFRLYTSLNTTVRTAMEVVPAGDRYTWTPQSGQIALI